MGREGVVSWFESQRSWLGFEDDADVVARVIYIGRNHVVTSSSRTVEGHSDYR